MGTIVVGVDGSKESQRALEWALETARVWDADVAVAKVYPYEPPDVPDSWVAHPEGIDTEGTARREHVREMLTRMVEQAERSANDVAVTLEPLVGSNPAKVLVERAGDADMLVIGSRGLGGFAGLLLGSVSRQCLEHATCPVAVVRE